jgi:hypothetical protein
MEYPDETLVEAGHTKGVRERQTTTFFGTPNRTCVPAAISIADVGSL